MSSSWKLVTAPAIEPLTLDEAKAHLRVDLPDENSFITALIAAARQVAEQFTRRALITQTWDLYLDEFPWQDRYESICIPRPPLQAVSYLKYTDIASVVQTLDPATYIVDTISEPGRIALAYLKFWPTYQSIANTVQVRFTAGYGDAAAAVPQAIRQAMLLMLSAWYDDRTAGTMPPGAQALLWAYRVAL